MVVKQYRSISPTIAAFHMCDSRAKCLVGAVGTGKTTAAIWEIGFNLPRRCYEHYGIEHTKWIIVRKTFEQLMETDFQEAMSWFVHADWKYSRKTMTLQWPASENCQSPLTVELIFMSCNTPEEEDKFRSMNVTGVWIDEADKVSTVAKQILKGRIGRFPKVSETPAHYTPAYFVETCNPFPIDHQMYAQYEWKGPKVLKEPEIELKCTSCEERYAMVPDGVCPKCGQLGEPTGNKFWRSGVYDVTQLVRKLPPGPIPPGVPVKGHIGFWQEAGENRENLREGYWEAIAADYKEAPEMVQLLVEGKPGFRPQGKPVYRNYVRDVHMAERPLIWKKERDNFTGEMKGVPLLMGWDNTGLLPAACLIQRVGPMSFQVLREYHEDRMGVVDFTKRVLEEIGRDFPGADITHYCDPAGFTEQSSKSGLTSNAQMQMDATGIRLFPSRQELDLRISAVDQLLARRDGLLIDPGCTRLLNGFFGGYVFEENIRMGLNEFKPHPKKDKFSHIHDALQYAVVPLVYPDIAQKRKDLNEPEFDDGLDEDYVAQAGLSVHAARGWRDRIRTAFGAITGERANTGPDPRRW